MLLFDRNQLGAALALISEQCLEEDPECEEDLLLILGYLTQDIRGYVEAIHNRNRRGLKALLDADCVSRKRELVRSKSPNAEILTFA